MITPLILDIISVVYGIYAVITLFNVIKNRVSFFDSRITQEDGRLASAFAFCFLWPPAVLLHEGGHALVASYYHARNIQLHFYWYWGEISFDPTITYRQDWWVALAGNIVTYALGFIGLAAARLPSLRTPIWRTILFSFGSNQLFVVLLWYPALCLFGVFRGDFSAIYGYNTPYWWFGSEVVAVVNIITAAGYIWANYTDSGKALIMSYLWGPPRQPQTQQIPSAESQKEETH